MNIFSKNTHFHIVIIRSHNHICPLIFSYDQCFSITLTAIIRHKSASKYISTRMWVRISSSVQVAKCLWPCLRALCASMRACVCAAVCAYL